MASLYTVLRLMQRSSQFLNQSEQALRHHSNKYNKNRKAMYNQSIIQLFLEDTLTELCHFLKHEHISCHLEINC